MINKQILAQIISDWRDILPNNIIPMELDIDCYSYEKKKKGYFLLMRE